MKLASSFALPEIHTIFREPCQRLLLHTLKLRSYNLNYSAARTLLHQSPHLASYFTTLVISLPPTGRALEEVESLQEVLGKLANVRRCILSGNADFYPWDALPPVLASAILEFLRRQTLSDLHITTLHNLPIAVFTTLLRAAPTLSFGLSSVTSTVDGLATDHLPTSPVVQNILLTECPSIVDLLESKGFQPHIANVRKLWVEPHSDHSGRILSIFASKLEFILFHSYSAHRTTVLAPAALAALDGLRARLRVRVQFSRGLAHRRGDLEAAPVRGLPQLHGQRRLVVEEYESNHRDLGEWARHDRM
ncbi:hypothetical protein B0H10DRAFT_2196695 [Mycena sp. CBHHK59/15]|nr:hypothetical protein B0H10DRAFT_2196695 [Mycena sp. CBHHK59/15]